MSEKKIYGYARVGNAEQALQPNSMLRKLGEAIGYDFSAFVGYDETEDADEDEAPDESPHIQM